MNDEMVRAGFEHGAEEVVPPKGMWKRVQQEITLREAAQATPWWRNWRRVAVAAAMLLVVGFGVTPQARASLNEILTIFMGTVDEKVAVIPWEANAYLDRATAEGKVGKMDLILVGSPEQAAAQTGMAAPLLTAEGATLRSTQAVVAEALGETRGEYRMITLSYLVSGEPYTVEREGLFVGGAHRAYGGSAVTAFGLPMDAEQATKAKGKALCYAAGTGESAQTVCHAVKDGFRLTVKGPNAKQVESLIDQVK